MVPLQPCLNLFAAYNVLYGVNNVRWDCLIPDKKRLYLVVAWFLVLIFQKVYTNWGRLQNIVRLLQCVYYIEKNGEMIHERVSMKFLQHCEKLVLRIQSWQMFAPGWTLIGCCAKKHRFSAWADETRLPCNIVH